MSTAVVEGTDADNAKSRERVSTTRGCGFDSEHRAFAFHSYIHMPEWTNPVYVLQLSIEGFCKHSSFNSDNQDNLCFPLPMRFRLQT